MKFRTKIDIPLSHIQIEHNNSISTIGSCFAENIARFFQYYKFNIYENPFGVLYNPASIFNAVRIIEEKTYFEEDDLIFSQGEWHSFYHHSSFSHHDAATCLKNINEAVEKTRDFLNRCHILIITYGTSYIYKSKTKGIIVSNCHKLPADQFERYMLSYDGTKEYIQSTLALLNHINPDLKIIFTVSPIRHWKDGAVNNQMSKGTLLLAINNAVQKNENCAYFPSYEIMMDELRDYRFYADDMLHPSKKATEYIWEKFLETHITDNCREIIKEIKPLADALNHRPRNIESDKYREFVERNLQLINELEKKYGYLNLHDDRNYFENVLKN